MRRGLLINALLAALLLGLNQTSCVSTRPRTPAQSQVILEAAEVVWGIGDYGGKILLVRLRGDGTVEWEKNLDARKRESHATKLSPEDAKSIRERLNAIDQSSFSGNMGPYDTYIDTVVELKIHLASNAQPRDLAVTNPWPSGISMKTEKPVPQPVKGLLCEIAQLRTHVSAEPLLITCKDEPPQRK